MTQGPHQAYDRDKLVELFGDDPRTLAEVEREFLETAREAAREIKGTDDFTVIARAAHRLKGASGMIGALALRQDRQAFDFVLPFSSTVIQTTTCSCVAGRV